jgi:hypothetical protein
MADGLSAVATNASPRAVAKASWSGSRKPFAETFPAKTPEIISVRTLNIILCWSIITDSLVQTIERTP